MEKSKKLIFHLRINVKHVVAQEQNQVQNLFLVLLVVGQGKVRSNQGFFTVQQTCPQMHWIWTANL